MKQFFLILVLFIAVSCANSAQEIKPVESEDVKEEVIQPDVTPAPEESTIVKDTVVIEQQNSEPVRKEVEDTTSQSKVDPRIQHIIDEKIDKEKLDSVQKHSKK